jgi:uncharacterized protein (TIGR02118 family)
MIQIVFCLRRRAGLTREAFLSRWFDGHAPLVRAQAATLGIRRYVQVHTLDDALWSRLAAVRGGPAAFDGVAELWFDDLDAMRAAAATPEGRHAGRVLLDDEREFIDLAASPIWIGRPRVVVGPS